METKNNQREPIADTASSESHAWHERIFIPYLILVLLHILPGLYMKQPAILADEVGYLGNARYISGVASYPDLRGCTYYQFGYSLLLVPIFRLFSDPITNYRAVILLNGFLISSTYFAIYYILHRLLSVGKRVSMWASFVACLYPAALVQSNYAWSENAFLPFYAFLIAAYGYFLIRKTYSAAILFGFLTGYLYAIHPRAISIAPLTCCFLIALAWTKALPKLVALAGIGTILLTTAITVLLNQHLLLAGWGGVNTAEAMHVSRVLTALHTYAGFKHYLLLLLGGILYLMQGTYLLFPLGVLYLFFQKLKRPAMHFPLSLLAEIGWSTSFFLLFTTFSIAVSMTLAMMLFVSPISPETGDYLIFGRYNEGFILPYIALGLVALQSLTTYAHRISNWKIPFVMSVLTMLLLFSWDENVWSIRVNPVDVWALYPVIRIFGEIRPAVMSCIAILIFLILKLTFRKTVAGGYVLLSSLFLFVAAYNYKDWIFPERHQTQYATAMYQSIQQLTSTEKISYDEASYNTLQFFSYQWLCPNVKFERFNSEKEQMPTSSAVISRKNWPYAELLEAKLVGYEKANGAALWVIPHSAIRLKPFFVRRNLATINIPGVAKSGFYNETQMHKRTTRWTNGNAKIEVRIGENRVSALRVRLAGTKPEGTNIEILVNGQSLYNGYIRGQWKNKWTLSGLSATPQLIIELRSDTFVPANTMKGSTDKRSLGVLVEDVQLLP